MKMPPKVLLTGLFTLIGLTFAMASTSLRADDALCAATLRPNVRTGFSNAGWNYDRYKDLEPLSAKKSITVADLTGPGVIRHIHTTRHGPTEIGSRGVVLEIWFDDAKEPAVRCPLGDFFGDGCNGAIQYFSTNLIECAPWSYNCYFTMPFAKRAKVIFVNDTDKNFDCYAYVEWEPLPKWDPSLGYFHATYRRKCFQLTKNTDEVFFEVKGTGHVLGRQFSVVTDEPGFKNFMYIMEGNNEINIDGRPRSVDYLGTEDSFTFSWGFQQPFIGQHAGMTLVDKGTPHRLSIYRFHDYMPIRFTKSLQWRINWREERHCHDHRPWLDASVPGRGWVDYATVFYWYQNEPGGFTHDPLRPCPERHKTLLKSSLPASEKESAKESVSSN
ncbi:MAG: DUF2961 domain-containing protein [Pirellulales bacterium]|nr:DUF2961 domain-containing protein [Pirellulales bacterium]